MYFIEDIVSKGFTEDRFFTKTAQNVYSILMIFNLTVLVLLMIRNFKRQVATIYFFFYFAPNRNKGINFLKTRTILLQNVEDLDMKGVKLTTQVDLVFHEKSIEGKMSASRFLADYRDIYDLEKEKRYY